VIERCHKCKTSKPINEFNAYGAFEHPCYDCCNGSKHKFTLPFEIWCDDFDVDKVSPEVGVRDTGMCNSLAD